MPGRYRPVGDYVADSAIGPNYSRLKTQVSHPTVNCDEHAFKRIQRCYARSTGSVRQEFGLVFNIVEGEASPVCIDNLQQIGAFRNQLWMSIEVAADALFGSPAFRTARISTIDEMRIGTISPALALSRKRAVCSTYSVRCEAESGRS